MAEIRIFKSHNSVELKEQVNDYISADVNLIDIKYNVIEIPIDGLLFSAMVIFEEEED